MQEQEDKQQKAAAEAIKKLDTTQFKYHKMSKQDVLKDLQTTLEQGISSAEAKKRLEKYGENQLAEEEGKSLWELIVEQFEDLLVRILLLAATISFIIALTGDGEEGLTAYVEPFVILLILVANAVIAIWQDQNADDALEALKQMQAEKCKCLRDGKWCELDAVELVPGDVVEVRMGDCVPADMRVMDVKSISLQAGQAALTGESVSVQKNDKQLGEDAKMLQDQKNMLFSSTIVSTGVGVGVVTYTGMNTAIGRVHSEVQAAKEDEEDTPLKQKLDQFGDLLAKVIFVICFLVWVMNYAKFFDPIHGSVVKGCIYYFKIAIALAVAAIPEGLPAVITTCLALGTRKMAANNCIVRRLQSVETLGCTSVICSDKTGTLTRNEMQAIKFGVLNGGVSASDIITHDVKGFSYSTEGQVIDSFSTDGFKKTEGYKLMAACCAIVNRARILFQENKFILQGEPTEGAIKVLAEKLGKYDPSFKATDAKAKPMEYSDYLDKSITRVATLEFSSARKSMSTVVKGFNGNSGNTVFLKGAPEQVIQKCSSILSKDGKSTQPMSETMKAQLTETIKENAGLGYRILGLAVMLDGGNMKHITAENAKDQLENPDKYNEFEKNGTFLGYVCIQDPERPEVKKSIEQCKTAGVNVIMITGDIKETAVAIAKKLNILDENADLKKQCFTGVEFSEMNDSQKKAALAGTKGKVFSRVEPSHKRELVKHLIEMGHIVAMTGDGVNDAPALKQAHIGIAMGITGTEVAKQASDMVLADDNFATIVKAVEEGRAIYSNMKAFIRYLISSNIGEVASIFITAMLGIPEGFNSVQLLWVNLVTDGPPATALGFNPPDTDIMQKKPRSHNENLISNWVFIRYMVIGMYVGFATVGIFVYWYVFADWTGDGHTLVTFDQLSHWNECPTWENFKVNDFIEGMDLQSNPCKYFIDGKVKASTLSLSVLVVIEMLNALNAISEDNSLFTMPPWINPYLILAIFGSIFLHIMIVHVPFFAKIFSITALNQKEWGLVFAFSSPVIIVDEILKTFGRSMNAKELKERLKQD